MQTITTVQKPVINCHTHIFIGESVPPHFGKTFIPLGLYKLFSIPFILIICRFWYLHPLSPRQWRHQYWYKSIQKLKNSFSSFINRYSIIKLLISIFNVVISAYALIYLSIWLISIFKGADTSTVDIINQIRKKLTNWRLLWLPESNLIRASFIIFTIFFIRNGRRILVFIGTKIIGIAGMIPDKKTLQFLGRYLNIGRFAYYKNSKYIFNKLKQQYDHGTGFILLPMDMEFMDAGKIKGNGLFENQMKELENIKRTNPKTAFPFVFVDPRRSFVGTYPFFNWTNQNDEVILGDCFIKKYIEELNFNGFKIYPALGYYPFDEMILPLWKYAADNQIPITTHCIRGTVFYRGTKKKEWGHHPVLMQKIYGSYEPLMLNEIKNEDFCNNFGHPLNYLCLLEERLLRLIVKNCSVKIKDLFGYKDENEPMERNLAHLKICFAHYGGDDEWRQYFEKDRDNYNSQLKTKPDTGINFMKKGDILNSFSLLEQIWKSVDWYSIITSIMLQYENVYADISYIIHDNDIVPLLKQTLQHKKLKTRVLFGTDFYVVRNHKSEKQMLADMMAHLDKAEFDLIARENPCFFLNQA